MATEGEGHDGNNSFIVIFRHKPSQFTDGILMTYNCIILLIFINPRKTLIYFCVGSCYNRKQVYDHVSLISFIAFIFRSYLSGSNYA